jgi:hypothetical protein
MITPFVPLPNLDDRRWADLVDEGRTLIPVYSPSWTDHNAHDPGITLMELLAWVAETDIYRVDRIPDSHLRAFLALVGIRLLPPSAARAAVVFALKKETAEAVELPATTLLDSASGRFQLRHRISVLPSVLAAVQVESGGTFRDVTGAWQRGKPIPLLGQNPKPGDSVYLGFDQRVERGATVSLFLAFSGDKAGQAERQRILDEIASRNWSCGRLVLGGCGQTPPAPSPELPPHHSAVIIWEVQTAPGVWQTVEATDDTRSLTLSGLVALTLPQTAAVVRTGAVDKTLAYLRARFASGSFDAAPLATRVFANAAEAEQCTPVLEQWAIAAQVVLSGPSPRPGDIAWLRFDFDSSGNLSRLDFASAANDTLPVRVLGYQPAIDGQTGHLTVEARRLGVGTGAPNQSYDLHGPELLELGFKLYTLDAGHLLQWRQRESLLASGPADADFVVEAGTATVRFGDGENGRVPSLGSAIIAVALETGGAAGNAAVGAISVLDPGLHNAALLGDDPSTIAKKFEQIANPEAALGGADEETLAHAEGRAVQMLQAPSRAVTLDDCVALALETPGANIARAAALANQHPAFQCYSAPGFITLVIIPHLPVGRPTPSAGLLSAVSAYLSRRHVVGTRIAVIGPEYLEVGVNAQVKAFPGQSKTAVRDAISTALEQFLDPLFGGPAGTGWPLGRDVYKSEVLDVIARVPSVDHVLSLELVVPDCGAQCGNVCLRPLALTVSGAHQIQVS